jgi:leucyl aminopeptidase
MKLTFADTAKADILAFIVDEGAGLPKAAAALDKSSGGLLTEAMTGGRFAGRKGQQALIVLPKDAPARRAVLIGGGKTEERTVRIVEQIGAELVKAHASSGFKSLAVEAGKPEDAARMALGAKLAAYRFDDYMTKLKPEQKPSLTTITFLSEDAKTAKSAFAPLDAATNGTYLARDLVNLPPNDLYPESFAARIKALETHGLEVEVLGEKQLAKLGMNAMLGVGQGSVRESQMVVIKWNGGKASTDPVVLIGKGVCFDTGGISLKPGLNMEHMRGDMGGAAAVVGSMLALAERKAKVNVVGIAGLVENMPDGNAQRPGDVVKSADGQTIEIQNTDAEGRLVLCDLIWYAQKNFRPKAMVDLATLTGAIVISLGHHHAGLFCNDDSLADELTKAGLEEGERVWRMPMGPEYDSLLKSKFADMRNIGGSAAGSISAAQFLKRFVKEGVRWAHIDIAGVAWVEGEKSPIDPHWASGYGPRLLDRWIQNNYEK